MIFFLLYLLKIKKYIENDISEIIKLYNTIWDNVLSMDLYECNSGICYIIDNLTHDPLNMEKERYKIEFPISQLIYPLKNNTIFSFDAKRQLICFKC